jgi:hypothetical protein
MPKASLVVPIILVLAAVIANGQTRRRAAGIIYFTNNTPRDLQSFPIEILKTTNHRLKLAYPDEHYRFGFSHLRPGKYVLRLTWPKHCVLSYRLDLTERSIESIEVIMDAACAHANGKMQDLPAN